MLMLFGYVYILSRSKLHLLALGVLNDHACVILIQGMSNHASNHSNVYISPKVNNSEILWPVIMVITRRRVLICVHY